MYAICSTRKGNVAKHVRQMKERNHNFPVYQFRADKYDDLSKNRHTVISATAKLTCEHIVDIQNGTLHRKNCADPNISIGMTVVEAHIIDPATTGLKMCKCMK